MRNYGAFSALDLVNSSGTRMGNNAGRSKHFVIVAPSAKPRTAFVWGSLQWLPVCYGINSRTLDSLNQDQQDVFLLFHILIAKEKKKSNLYDEGRVGRHSLPGLAVLFISAVSFSLSPFSW